MIKRLLVLSLLPLVFVSCQSADTTYVKDGINYSTTDGVFRGRWWSYYERGSNLMRGGFYEAAAADFRRAVSGRSSDTWRARTYGLHFVEFFPNRELAVALQNLGQLDEAKVYIERSLASIDTARGHHYLDAIVREQIARGDLRDDRAPTVTTSVTDGMLTASLDVALKIAAADDIGVDEIKVNGTELYQRGSSEDIVLEQVLALSEGAHEITVEVKDLADKVTTETVKITVDLTGPTIGIREPEDALVTESASVALIGSTVDKNGVISVSLDGRVLSDSQGERRLEFHTVVPLQDGENRFIVMARDRAGNETRTAINVYKGGRETTAAKLWLLEQKAPELLQVAAASPAMISALLESVLAAEDQQAVRIKLKSPKEGKVWRNDRAIRISGEVIANTKVAKLMINGKPFEDLTGEPKESFNRRIPMSEITDKDVFEGNVSITIAVVAEDDAANEAEATFEVLVKPVQLQDKKSLMTLAVLAFGGSSDERLRSDMRTISETAISETRRFRLLERQELAAVLSEQQLSDALADPAAAIRLGRLLPAHAFIVADVIDRGLEAEIHARVVSTESTELMIPVVDTHIENVEDLASIRKACDDLAEELFKAFPRISGQILSARGDRILINWGEDDGVIVGMRLKVVYQEEPWIDEDTGEILEEGDTVPVAEARITRVTSSTTTAERVQPEEEEEAIEFVKEMPVITM